MNILPYKNINTTKQLEAQLSQRIMLIDGAMGTMIQDARLDESDYHGERFSDHQSSLKGNRKNLYCK